MPHVIVEYSANLDGQVDIPQLLQVIATHCGDSGGVLPLAGVRVRAIRLTDYVIADGKAEYAMVNITVKMGSGRDPEFKKTFFGAMFSRIQAELAPTMTARPVALSLYVEELDEDGAYRDNGVRQALGLPQKGKSR